MEGERRGGERAMGGGREINNFRKMIKWNVLCELCTKTKQNKKNP